ncbi:MAG: hypothetical protein P8Q40_00405, partial [Candidatus Poseidonia sp.]|uniref:hypothetical protein n=1 Tax=Poseidonia sp. TaxID=2666344 RepID=UPI0030C52A39|nr:hypothetical protein [Poseidonia sp.]
MYPIPGSLANQTLSLEVGCLDEQGVRVTQTANITVGPQEPCVNCTSDDNNQGDATEQNDPLSSAAIASIAMLAFIIILGAIGFAVKMNKKSSEEMDWAVEEDTGHDLETMFDNDDLMDQEEPELLQEGEIEHDFIPDDWTREQYVLWLNGPLPEGWEIDQWADYVSEHKAKLNLHDIVTEG